MYWFLLTLYITSAAIVASILGNCFSFTGIRHGGEGTCIISGKKIEVGLISFCVRVFYRTYWDLGGFETFLTMTLAVTSCSL